MAGRAGGRGAALTTGMRLVLLPGMDGTGRLFAPFVAAAPDGVEFDVVPLPTAPMGYAALAAALDGRVAVDDRTVLVAESFAGPLAIALAATRMPAALVLVNSFVRPPLPAALCRMAPAALFSIPTPDAALRAGLVGAEAHDALVSDLRHTLADVPAELLAARVRALATLDARATLARITCPLLYLRGGADRLVPERCVKDVVDAAPRAEVARIAGPHLLLQASPVAAWAALRSFLSRLTPT